MGISLSFSDYLVIAIYFIAILGIGYYLKGFTKTGEDFFLAGRRNSSWVAGLAFLSANLGALEILGWTGATMKYGMFVGHFYWIGAIPAMLFLGVFMMPFYYSSRIHSVPGYLRLRFDEKTRLLNAFSFAIMTLLMSGINLYLMALVFHVLLRWDLHVSMWVSALAVAVYITLGGLMSAIFTEILQFFLIWAGLFLVAILGIAHHGGIQNLLSGLPDSMSHLWATSFDPTKNEMGVTWAGIVMGLGFVLSFGYWTTDFLVVQRAFSAKDLRSAMLCPITASFFKMALPIIVVGGGLVAYKLHGQGALPLPENPLKPGEPWNDATLPMLIARYYPTGLVGLGVTALLAGFMAGQAGNVSAFNTVWTYDLYRVLIKKDASDSHLVWVGRVTTLVGIIISIATAYVAMHFTTIMDYIQAIFSWVNAPLFATMLLGMFSKRITSAGAFYGLLLGMITSFSIFMGFKLGVFGEGVARILCFSPNPSDMARNLWQAWWAFFVCFVATAVISMFTKPKPAEELKGLVSGLTERARYEGLSWFQKPAPWALLSLLVLIVINVMFF